MANDIQELMAPTFSRHLSYSWEKNPGEKKPNQENWPIGGSNPGPLNENQRFTPRPQWWSTCTGRPGIQNHCVRAHFATWFSEKGSCMQSLISTIWCWAVSGRNLRTGIMFVVSSSVHIWGTCMFVRYLGRSFTHWLSLPAVMVIVLLSAEITGRPMNNHADL